MCSGQRLSGEQCRSNPKYHQSHCFSQTQRRRLWQRQKNTNTETVGGQDGCCSLKTSTELLRNDKMRALVGDKRDFTAFCPHCSSLWPFSCGFFLQRVCDRRLSESRPLHCSSWAHRQNPTDSHTDKHHQDPQINKISDSLLQPLVATIPLRHTADQNRLRKIWGTLQKWGERC